MTGSASCKKLRIAWLALVGCGLLARPTPASAQTIRGTVVDAESGVPVTLAYIGLLAPGRELVVASLADARGGFSIRAPAAGSYFLYVSRAGYRTVLDGLYDLGDDGVVEVAIGLRPSPIALDPVVVDVEGGVRDLRTVGFYERRERGLGHFIEREEIRRVAIDDLTDAMRGIPGLVVETPAPSLLVPVGVLNPEVLVRTASGLCSPTLYVDGVVVAFGQRSRLGSPMAVRPDDFVDPSDAEAIEVYTGPADTPPEYESANGCGVVLIWTRKR